MLHTRTCQHCRQPLHCAARADTLYCSGRCRVAAHRGRHTDDSAAAIPSALRDRDRWVRHDAKRPVTVTGRAASSTDPRTWATYAAAHASTVGDGLGFILDGEGGLICIDIDHCIEDGNLAPWAARILAGAPATFTEVSPSGSGLHLWGLGELDRGRVVKVDGGKVEVYGGPGRYITISGQPFEGAPSDLAPIGDLIAALTA